MSHGICVGCDVGSDAGLLATLLSLVGAATGIAGAITGILAYRSSQANHDAQIFREEFSRHRVPLETALQTIKRHLVVIRASARPLLPIGTMVANLGAVRHETELAVSSILSEADEIDQRALLGTKWVPAMSRFQAAVETSWEVVDDPAQPDQARLQAALTIVANLEGLASVVRERVEECVRVPLSKKRWKGGA